VALTILNIIGSVAFALSGALVAIEEEYDIFGILVLGLITAFAGGMIRNLIVGLPVAAVWHQTWSFASALIAMFVAIVFPVGVVKYGIKPMLLFDAMGLATFAVEGALYAERIHGSAGTILVAAAMTGVGGGVIRDVLAQRKPTVLRADTYAVWALLAGAVVSLGWVNPYTPWRIYALIGVIFVLRILSLVFNWRLPRAGKAT
jgi:uncharacterized membrane protein YeiH